MAFHYPPEASSSGVLRTLKYSRYLNDFGWRVTVISPQEDAYEVVDQELVRQIPSTTRVIRTNYLNTKRHLSFRGIHPALFALPDRWVGWLPWGVAAGKDLFRKDPYQLIYSTSPHATAHLIAWRLARATGLRWVSDFRDPWVEDPPEPGAPAGFVYTRLNTWLERQVIMRSDKVIASTGELRDLLRERYAQQPAEKFQAILNGYDEADFEGLPTPHQTSGNCMVILHAGSINASFRDPRPLLRALARAAALGTIDLSKIRIRFLGGGAFSESAELRSTVSQLKLTEVVEFVGRVPYSEALMALAEADLLLLLQASPDTTGLVPAKLYEYLRSGKPVLALVHKGATGEVLRETGGGWSVEPGDEADLSRALHDAYDAWRAGNLGKTAANAAVLRRFERKALTRELAEVFDNLVSAP